MVFDPDITLKSLAAILLHLTLWRGPMRRQSDFFYDEVPFHNPTSILLEYNSPNS